MYRCLAAWAAVYCSATPSCRKKDSPLKPFELTILSEFREEIVQNQLMVLTSQSGGSITLIYTPRPDDGVLPLCRELLRLWIMPWVALPVVDLGSNLRGRRGS